MLYDKVIVTTPLPKERRISRRQALKYVGGGAYGLAALFYGLDRKKSLAFLNKDALSRCIGCGSCELIFLFALLT